MWTAQVVPARQLPILLRMMPCRRRCRQAWCSGWPGLVVCLLCECGPQALIWDGRIFTPQSLRPDEYTSCPIAMEEFSQVQVKTCLTFFACRILVHTYTHTHTQTHPGGVPARRFVLRPGQARVLCGQAALRAPLPCPGGAVPHGRQRDELPHLQVSGTNELLETFLECIFKIFPTIHCTKVWDN